MSAKAKRKVSFPPEIEEMFERVATRIAESVVAGLERSAVLEKLLERVEKSQPATAKLPPIPLKPDVALGLLMGKTAKREPLLTRKLGGRSTIRPTVTYRVDPRRAAGGPTPTAEAPTASLLERSKLLGGPLPPPPPARLPQVKKGGTRGVFALLYEEKGRKVLAGLINQLRFGRTDLVEKINLTYQGMPGVPLQEEDALRVVHYHNLTSLLHRREAEIICRQLNKMRGSLAKTAQKLKVSPELLNERIQELKLSDEVARIRQRFCEEILERMTLRDRLELALTRAKYLADLNVEQQVDALNKQELQQKLDSLRGGGAEECRRTLTQELGLDDDRYDRLLRRYGLTPGGSNGELLPAGNAT